ncbi:MAG: sodium:solute symporter family protein [Candidatus Hydrogenedentes bacterium]|nr:sodium:solute symporter family protein [Candidatus Hydrogenedentota bacterium]
MQILGLELVIWVVLGVYFAGMVLMGWFARRQIHDQDSYLLGNRAFNIWYMVMHAFGAGTNPGDVAGVVSKTVDGGAAGVWVSWMWLFGTPFYWIIAPIVRRLRAVTMADYFEQRYGGYSSVLYVLLATLGMTMCLASVLLATTRTVQGMMGKASGPDADLWFFGILFSSTLVFVLYGYFGGIIAAIKTDMIQGIMIIVLSILALPAALNMAELGGWAEVKAILRQASSDETNYLAIVDTKSFDLLNLILLSLSAPLTGLALPHLATVCGSGRTEWESRVGFATGNFLKRLCTMGWCVLALCWLAYLIQTGTAIHPDAAFGDSVRSLLSPFLQGLMLACVMAAAMSSGDAFQVTVAGLFSNNIYKRFVNPEASEATLVKVTRLAGLGFVGASLAVAIAYRNNMVNSIMDYFRILGFTGVAIAVGIVWRRMNGPGVYVGLLSAALCFLVLRYGLKDVSSNIITGLPLLAGITGCVVGSLVTRPSDPKRVELFLKRIYTPIGHEEMLERDLDQVVPPANRIITFGGLFIVKPTRQTWVGFSLFLAMCIACVLILMVILGG